MTLSDMVKKLEAVTTELKEQSCPPGPYCPESKDVNPLNIGDEVEIWMQGWKKTKVDGVNSALNECSTELGPTIRYKEENVYWRRVVSEKGEFRYRGEPSPGYEYIDGGENLPAPAGITERDIEIANLKAEVAELETELETERMKLVACGVAALSNTRDSFEEQGLPFDSPYWSASYKDVRRAVRREMEHRENLESSIKDYKQLAHDCGEQNEEILILQGQERCLRETQKVFVDRADSAELETLQIKAALEKALNELTDSPYPVVETAVKFLQKRAGEPLTDDEALAVYSAWSVWLMSIPYTVGSASKLVKMAAQAQLDKCNKGK